MQVESASQRRKNGLESIDGDAHEQQTGQQKQPVEANGDESAVEVQSRVERWIQGRTSGVGGRDHVINDGEENGVGDDWKRVGMRIGGEED